MCTSEMVTVNRGKLFYIIDNIFYLDIYEQRITTRSESGTKWADKNT